ncbi:hypothetical protein MLD38_030817 [Melastoma candidum]|uniref:Uncharacterized protein n=1 Tax=Melastoma candidum TaxID=119954 RepID=A0ACB9MPR0_9MYRT|nr:hypothetical protein MLD38_030817 [Melastoma candidum]
MAANNYGDVSSGAAAVSDNTNSPSHKLRRPMWNQIVRGGESEHQPHNQQQHPIPPGDSQFHSAAAAAVVASGMDVNGLGLGVSGGEEGGLENGVVVVVGGGGAGVDGNSGKRHAWKKPAGEVTVQVGEAGSGVVMGAESWPALSGSSRPGKATISGLGTPKGLVDGSQSAQVSAPSLISQKQADDSATPNSGYASPSRQSQKSTKRSGTSSSSNGILAMELPASPGSPADSKANNPSPRDVNVRSGVSSNSHVGNELLQQHRNSFKSRNGGTYSHGDGHHRQNFGSRRDQERSNQDWNHRNANSSRDNHATHQRGPQRYGRSPPPPPPPLPAVAPFMTPVPVRPYGAPLPYTDLQSPYYIYPIQSPTFYQPIQPQLIYQPPPDNTVHSRILSQIDYYFSNENLVKDTFLRQNMDEQGWVPISLIARFNKISQLTDNVQIILDVLHHSNVVEVQGDKIRKRDDWRRWIMPAGNPFPVATSPRFSEILNPAAVASGVQSLLLDGRETHLGAGEIQLHDAHGKALRRMPSGDSSIPGETGEPSNGDSHSTSEAAIGTGQ